MKANGRRGAALALVVVLLAMLAGPVVASDATFSEKARALRAQDINYGRDGHIPPLVDFAILRPMGLIAIGVTIPIWAAGLPFVALSTYGPGEYTRAMLGEQVRFTFGTPLGGH